MSDHVVDVVDSDACRIKDFIQQDRRIRDRDPLNRPGVREHSGTRVPALRIGETQPAMVGDGGEAGKADRARTGIGAFQHESRSGVPERQACEFFAHDGADVAGGVLAQRGDVLAADDQSPLDDALPYPVCSGL